MAKVYRYEKWSVGTTNIYRWLEFQKQPYKGTTSTGGWVTSLSNAYTSCTTNGTSSVTLTGTKYTTAIASTVPLGTILYVYNSSTLYYERYIREDCTFGAYGTFCYRALSRWLSGTYKNAKIEDVYAYEGVYPYDGYGWNGDNNYWYTRMEEYIPKANFLTTNNITNNCGYANKESSETFSHSNMLYKLNGYGFYTMSYITFTNVTIPKGSIINAANVEITPVTEAVNVNDIIVSIDVENVSNSVTPTSYTDLNNRLLTGKSKSWNVSCLSWYTNFNYKLPDIAEAIQTVVNRSDWVSGNNITILMKTVDGYSTSISKTATINPSLYVAYTPPNTPPTAPGAFTNPTGVLRGGQQITVSWGESTDADNNLLGYLLSYSLGGGAYGSEINISSPTTSYTMIVPVYNTIQFRVRAYDVIEMESSYTYSSVFTITNKTQIGTYPMICKNGIKNIPLYDPATMPNSAYRAFTAKGKVGCFDVQDITGTELVRITGKTKIRGIKI